MEQRQAILAVPFMNSCDTETMRDDCCSMSLFVLVYYTKIYSYRDFPGGAAVKNPPANAGDTGSIAGPGRSHIPRSN